MNRKALRFLANNNLNALLDGYSGATGGASTSRLRSFRWEGQPIFGTLLLPPHFFAQGGFSSYTISGIGGMLSDGQYLTAVNIAPGAIIDPVAESLIVEPAGGGMTKLVPYLEPEGVRTPVSLTFDASGVTTGDSVVALGSIVEGSGAVIRTDASGSVNFDGQTVVIEVRLLRPAARFRLRERREIL